MSEREKTPPTVILRPTDRAKKILSRAATGTPTARAAGSPPRGGGPSSRRRRRVVHSVRISSDWVSRAIARADRLHSAARFSSRFPISESSTHTCRMRTIIIIIFIKKIITLYACLVNRPPYCLSIYTRIYPII